jgi:hypothetical protein
VASGALGSVLAYQLPNVNNKDYADNQWMPFATSAQCKGFIYLIATTSTQC